MMLFLFQQTTATHTLSGNIRDLVIDDIGFYRGNGIEIFGDEYCLFRNIGIIQTRGVDAYALRIDNKGYGTSQFENLRVAESVNDFVSTIGGASVKFSGCVFGEGTGNEKDPAIGGGGWYLQQGHVSIDLL